MSRPARLRRLQDFLGLRRSITGLLGMVILVGMGEHMAEQFLPKYLVALGGGILSAGGLNALDNLLGALYAFPGGYLADRYGNRRALLIFNLLAMAGFAIVILIPAWPAVLVGAVFFLSWTAISLPATMGLVATVLPKNQRTMGVSVHSLVRRIPMALGPLAGGALITAFGTVTGVRLAFVAALLLALVALIMQQRLIAPDPPRSADAGPEKSPLKLWRRMSPGLRQLLVADILVRFCEQIPYAFVVLYVTVPPAGHAGLAHIARPVSDWQFGLLRAIEMATAVLVYIPVACLADRAGKKPFVVLTFVFFTLFPLALLGAPSFGWLVLVFVLRGLKEFGEPARKALIMDLAPEDRKAAMFGLYYLVRDTVVSVAALAGGLLWLAGPTANLLTACTCGALGTVWFALRGRDLAIK
jgi:MFS family permease